jgi:hypothetical protein
MRGIPGVTLEVQACGSKTPALAADFIHPLFQPWVVTQFPNASRIMSFFNVVAAPPFGFLCPLP